MKNTHSRPRYGVFCLTVMMVLAMCASTVQAQIGDNLERNSAQPADGSSDSGPLEGLLNGLLGGLGNPLARLDAQRLDPLEGATSFETSVEHNGVGRRVVYVRPPNEPARPAPAVVMLPYNLATSERMINITNAEKLAARFGVWVIVPQATLRHWPVDPNFSDRDEPEFISKVIRDATRRYPVDADRVFLAGLSNGAFMTNRYLCQNTDLIAGAAVVAASFYRKRAENQCETTGSVPMLLIQGTYDLFVPYGGSLKYLSAEETFQYWRDRNGCDPAQTSITRRSPQFNDGSRVTQKQNYGCRDDSAVKQLTVDRGGHAWPGGKVQIELLGPYGPNTRNLDATLELWTFFSLFTRD